MVQALVGSEGLSSVSEALDSSRTVTAQQLYAPYGGSRYSSGSMPTSYGYMGQHADATTGLGYYNARYYDASAGQFSSADSVLGADPLGMRMPMSAAWWRGQPIQAGTWKRSKVRASDRGR